MHPRTTTITTASSVWVFDHEAKTYTRTPREPNTTHEYTPYPEGAVAYESADLPLASGRFFVTETTGRSLTSYALDVVGA